MSVGADPTEYSVRYPETPDPLRRADGRRVMEPHEILERERLNRENTGEALRKRVLAELAQRNGG